MAGIVTEQGVRMSKDAAKCVQEAGVNVSEDVLELATGKTDAKKLLALCLDLAEPDRVEGWREYVDAVVSYAAVARTLLRRED